MKHDIKRKVNWNVNEENNLVPLSINNERLQKVAERKIGDEGGN